MKRKHPCVGRNRCLSNQVVAFAEGLPFFFVCFPVSILHFIEGYLPEELNVRWLQCLGPRGNRNRRGTPTPVIFLNIHRPKLVDIDVIERHLHTRKLGFGCFLRCPENLKRLHFVDLLIFHS